MPIGVTNAVATCDRSLNLPLIETNDAAPKLETIYSVPRDTTVRLSLVLMARAPDGRSKTWTVTRTGKNVDGSVSLVGSPPAATIEADQGTAAWGATLSADGENVVLTVTGEVGPVHWVLLKEFLLLSTAA